MAEIQQQKKEYYLVGLAIGEIEETSPPTLRRLIQNMFHELELNPRHITVRQSAVSVSN